MVNHTPVPVPVVPGMPRTSLPAGAPPLGERNANTAPAAAPSPADGAKRGAKRKSTDALPEDPEELKAAMFPPELDGIEDDDPRLLQFPRETCNQIRKRIRAWVDRETGGQKIGEFQRTLGVSSVSYNRFMNLTGTWDGVEKATYQMAQAYFCKRRLLGLPLSKPKPKPKKAKTTAAAAAADADAGAGAGAGASASASASAGAGAGAAKKGSEELEAKVAKLLDTCDDITLPGEGTEAGVPVYDTPHEIRKKFRAVMAKEGVTKSAFMRSLSKMIPDLKAVSAMGMKTFMGQKDTMDGNTSKLFYAGYLLFEKQRIRDGKPKSAFRLEMEARHGPEGVERLHNVKNGFICMANERPHIDKYGSLQLRTV